MQVPLNMHSSVLHRSGGGETTTAVFIGGVSASLTNCESVAGRAEVSVAVVSATELSVAEKEAKKRPTMTGNTMIQANEIHPAFLRPTLKK